MKTKNNLIYSFIFTILLTMWIIWSRFIRERLPKDITFEYFNIYIVILLFLSTSLILMYYLLTLLKVIPNPKSKFSLFIQHTFNHLKKKPRFIVINNFINEHILEGPSNTYKIIYEYVYIKPFIHQIGSKLSYHFSDYPLVPYVIAYIIPKTLPWIILLIEITLFQHIEYFYKVIIIFIVPLIFNIMLFIIKQHAIESIQIYEKYYDFVVTEDTIHVFLKQSSDAEFKEKQDFLLPTAANYWEFFQDLYNVTYQINYRKNLYKYHLGTIIYTLITLSFLFELVILLKS